MGKPDKGAFSDGPETALTVKSLEPATGLELGLWRIESLRGEMCDRLFFRATDLNSVAKLAVLGAKLLRGQSAQGLTAVA